MIIYCRRNINQEITNKITFEQFKDKQIEQFKNKQIEQFKDKQIEQFKEKKIEQFKNKQIEQFTNQQSIDQFNVWIMNILRNAILEIQVKTSNEKPNVNIKLIEFTNNVNRLKTMMTTTLKNFRW